MRGFFLNSKRSTHLIMIKFHMSCNEQNLFPYVLAGFFSVIDLLWNSKFIILFWHLFTYVQMRQGVKWSAQYFYSINSDTALSDFKGNECFHALVSEHQNKLGDRSNILSRKPTKTWVRFKIYKSNCKLMLNQYNTW